MHSRVSKITGERKATMSRGAEGVWLVQLHKMMCMGISARGRDRKWEGNIKTGEGRTIRGKGQWHRYFTFTFQSTSEWAHQHFP